MNDQFRATDSIHVTTSLKPVSVRLGDTLLAESEKPLIVHEPGYPPRYYFPRGDVRMDALAASRSSTTCPHKGTAEYFHLNSDGADGRDIAWSYPSPYLSVAEISGFIAFYDDVPGIAIG